MTVFCGETHITTKTSQISPDDQLVHLFFVQPVTHLMTSWPTWPSPGNKLVHLGLRGVLAENTSCRHDSTLWHRPALVAVVREYLLRQDRKGKWKVINTFYTLSLTSWRSHFKRSMKWQLLPSWSHLKIPHCSFQKSHFLAPLPVFHPLTGVGK